MTATIAEKKVDSKATAEKTAAQKRMDVAREAQKRLNDYGNNAKFQKWLKTAKTYKLTMKDGKEILWNTLDTVSAFELKVSVANFDDYLSFLFTGLFKQLVRSWVREWALMKTVKISYVEYLQEKLDSAEIDYLDAESYKASQA